MNANSEIAIVGGAAAWGAHAAGVRFSAVRRKLRTTHFFARTSWLEPGHDNLGEPPKPARGPHALRIFTSEFAVTRLAAVAMRSERRVSRGSGRIYVAAKPPPQTGPTECRVKRGAPSIASLRLKLAL